MNYFLNGVIYVIIFCMGAVLFAYLNYVIVRLPKKEKLTDKKAYFSCCGHEQTVTDGLPILSYLLSRGRCRYCGEKISKREFFLPVLGGILAVISTLIYGISLENALVFLVICDLAVITFIDIDTMEIPPVLNLILLILGILSYFVMPDGPTLIERGIGLICISLPMMLIAFLFNGFGGGDVKMMFAAGALLGWKGILGAFVIGAVLGGIFGVYVLATKKMTRKSYFAFGPFLAIGVLISMLGQTGARMVQSYLDYIHLIMLQ